MRPRCDNCGGVPRLEISAGAGRNGARAMWWCDCGACARCITGTTRPDGPLQTNELRAAKRAAHEAFDPLWQSGRMERTEAYALLAILMGLEPPLCHIRLFDKQQCERVVEICTRLAATIPLPAANAAQPEQHP